MLSVVDSTILQHVLDLLCTLLKKTDKEAPEFQKIISVFPQLMNFVQKSEDMFLLLHGTAALKNFIFVGHQEILKITTAEEIIEVAKKLLSPSTNEQAAMCLGNLVIQIFHKIQPKIDTSVLFCVVQKIYKTRMPTTLQSLVLIFARLIQTNPKEIVELLSETSVDNRISLKVVLDKWLLQQPLFRGQYTRIVTLSALQKLFFLRDSRIESLMVIGYNPSHSNINSEVNAPFKILSTLLRFLDNESKHEQPSGAFEGYHVPRSRPLGNERLDTMEGQNDLYYDEEESDYDNSSKGINTSQEKIEVNLDDIEDEDDQECLLNYKQDELNKKGGSGELLDQIPQSTSPDQSLFKIKESNDKGLADMETGSEVYMSELLVSK